MQLEQTGLSPLPSMRRASDTVFQSGHSVLMWCVNPPAACIGFILITAILSSAQRACVEGSAPVSHRTQALALMRECQILFANEREVQFLVTLFGRSCPCQLWARCMGSAIVGHTAGLRVMSLPSAPTS